MLRPMPKPCPSRHDASSLKVSALLKAQGRETKKAQKEVEKTKEERKAGLLEHAVDPAELADFNSDPIAAEMAEAARGNGQREWGAKGFDTAGSPPKRQRTEVASTAAPSSATQSTVSAPSRSAAPVSVAASPLASAKRSAAAAGHGKAAPPPKKASSATNPSKKC